MVRVYDHVFLHPRCALYSIRNNETCLESSTTNNIYCLNCKKCVTLHNNNNTTLLVVLDSK